MDQQELPLVKESSGTGLQALGHPTTPANDLQTTISSNVLILQDRASNA